MKLTTTRLAITAITAAAIAASTLAAPAYADPAPPPGSRCVPVTSQGAIQVPVGQICRAPDGALIGGIGILASCGPIPPGHEGRYPQP